MRSGECGVGVRSAEWGVRSAEWGVRSGECGVRSGECGVGSGERGPGTGDCIPLSRLCAIARLEPGTERWIRLEVRAAEHQRESVESTLEGRRRMLSDAGRFSLRAIPAIGTSKSLTAVAADR
jgi:hypothetical protein